jgi:uncharacterized protein (TIGR03086 family)
VDPIAILQRTLEGAERMVAGLRPEELTLPTPCPDWNVRQLVEHMIGTNFAFAAGTSGQPPSGPPPDTQDLAATYAASAQAALAGWKTPGVLERTLNLPFGQIPGAQAIGFNIGDELVHTWDLAKATGRDRTLDAAAVAVVHAGVQLGRPPEARGPGGPFGPEQPCPPDASPSDRLAAFLGRKV